MQDNRAGFFWFCRVAQWRGVWKICPVAPGFCCGEERAEASVVL